MVAHTKSHVKGSFVLVFSILPSCCFEEEFLIPFLIVSMFLCPLHFAVLAQICEHAAKVH